MAAKKSPKSKAKTTKAATVTARKIRPGFFSHTELASTNPAETKAWCQAVFGWKFAKPMPTPTGPYEMWNFGNNSGGGIRLNNPPENPGTVPYAEVASIHATYDRALKAGADPMFPPDEVPGGNRWIAIVKAPGGVPIGLWGPK